MEKLIKRSSFSDTMRTAQLFCIVFRKKGADYEYLLLRRISTKGGFWQAVSGGYEESDVNKLEAAYREMKEEAGIDRSQIIRVIEEVHQYTYDKHYLTGEPITPITEYVYGFEVGLDMEVRMDRNIYTEHDEYRWVSFEEALSLLKWEANKEAFRKLKEKIS